jgi:hypothetical protein
VCVVTRDNRPGRGAERSNNEHTGAEIDDSKGAQRLSKKKWDPRVGREGKNGGNQDEDSGGFRGSEVRWRKRSLAAIKDT